MDLDACKSFFTETYTALEVFRLMYPTEWRQNLTGDIMNKYITCVEVESKIMSLTNETLLRKLCLHVNDVLVWAQAIETALNTPPEPTVDFPEPAAAEDDVMLLDG